MRVKSLRRYADTPPNWADIEPHYFERPRCVDRLPSHISKMVVSTVHDGGPIYIESGHRIGNWRPQHLRGRSGIFDSYQDFRTGNTSLAKSFKPRSEI